MLVNLYEPKGFNRDKDWVEVKDAGVPVLQMQEVILNQLNGSLNFNNPTFKKYIEAMENIHSNLFLNTNIDIPEEQSQADDFLGSLGVSNTYKVTQKGNKYV